MKDIFYVILNGLLLGLGLSMDAFTVSIANGLNEPDMPLRRGFLIAGTFSFFQILMPLIGFGMIRLLGQLLPWLSPLVPWLAFVLLAIIGIKMILDGRKKKSGELSGPFTYALLLLQGIATSIDALSAGLTMASLGLLEALTEALIIGAVTFADCFLAVRLGKKLGMRLSWKASIIGGIVLILVGTEILVRGLFF